ncbi:MAG: hypothetical protein GX148_05570 [Clostridiales bacterium]|nr:hypothetical protein [Clostridiales bacterium]
MKKLLAFLISLALVITAFVTLSLREDASVQVIAGSDIVFKPVNIIQLVKSLFG